MKRILFILGKWENGGIERVITSYCTNLPKDKYQIDILPLEYCPSLFDQQVIEYGATIIKYNMDTYATGYMKNNIKRISIINSITSKNYDIIHYNTAFAMAYIHCFFIKLSNPNIKIIMHSHGDSVNAPHIYAKKLFHYLIRSLFNGVVDYGLACSSNSGKWLFTKKFYNSSKYTTLMNALDLQDKAFDMEKRKKYRAEYDIPNDTFVFGTIGRIEYQKNPFFLLDIIDNYRKIHMDFKFLWIGNGTDKEEIVRLATEKELNNNIIFIESTTDVSGMLSVMDLFILPSRYEGLGVVLIEAQANGLRCLVSTTTSLEADITGKICFIPIDNSNLWVQKIVEYNSINLERNYPTKAIKNSGFDTKEIIKKLISIYDDE